MTLSAPAAGQAMPSMTAPPRISCLMPVYNGEEFLQEAVDSILSQTCGDFELVVVDDGSTDRTAEILRHYSAKDPRVRVLTKPNGGIVSALNAGLAACRGEHVARMDADDVALPRRFEWQLAHLDVNPSCVLVGGLARHLLPGGVRGGTTTGGRHRRTDLTAFPPKVAVSMHPLIMVRRAALEVIGGYRADFPHAEDYDLFIRLSRLGTIDNPEIEVLLYRRHDNALSIRHLEVQERAAAMAEIEAMCAGRERLPAWLTEPYIRLRIWRRYLSVEPGKARALLPRLLRDVAALSPRTLASPDYWRLRIRMIGSLAAAQVRNARRARRTPPENA